jgi:hypothetical protein
MPKKKPTANLVNNMLNKIPANGIIPADQELTVTMTAKDGGYRYGCGSLLDLLAYAAEESTSADLETWDAEAEAVAQTWAEDGRMLVRDSLNELNPAAVCGIVQDPDITPGMFKDSEYLPGDFLELEHPRTFARIVDGISPHDAVRGEGPAWLMPEALTLLEKAEGYIQEDALREWLDGDYRGNYPGVLRLIPRAMFGKYTEAEMSWNSKTDTVTITATAQEWADYLGEDWTIEGFEDLLQLPRDGASCDYEKNLSADVLATASYSAERRAERLKAKAEANHAERAAAEARALENKKAEALKRAKSKR